MFKTGQGYSFGLCHFGWEAQPFQVTKFLLQTEGIGWGVPCSPDNCSATEGLQIHAS